VAYKKGAQPVTDPKHYPPGASWAGQPENTTGETLTADHILDIVERDQLRGMVEELRYVVRGFLEIIADNHLEAVFGDLDWAKELLARE
jgi:hypothetical protein